MAEAFKVGDVVTHKSNLAVRWVVDYVEGNGTLRCHHVTGGGEVKETKFLPPTVMLVKDDVLDLLETAVSLMRAEGWWADDQVKRMEQLYDDMVDHLDGDEK